MKEILDYQYDLPERLIAKKPASPRDSSRLFVYDTGKEQISFDIFSNIDKYLPIDSFLVFNDTKVLPARVKLKKEKEKVPWRGGGVAEILIFVDRLTSQDNIIRGFSYKKIIIGQKLYFPDGNFLKVLSRDDKVFSFEPSFKIAEIYELLYKYGETPIPKYIGGSEISENELRKKYQSIFASKPSSIAAPTASLHFTDNVFEKIKNKAIQHSFVTLNVGLGTFAPVSQDNFLKKSLHKEYFSVKCSELFKINKARSEKKRIVAVGTTTTRVLESFFGLQKSDLCKNKEGDYVGETDIFIHPPYSFKVTGGLITNFHLPCSSLMMLVDAFLKNKKAKKSILELYKIAISENFRFYSFGDAMMII